MLKTGSGHTVSGPHPLSDLPFLSLHWLTLLQLPWSPYCSPNTPGTLLPQGLCTTFWALSWDALLSSPHGSLPPSSLCSHVPFSERPNRLPYENGHPFPPRPPQPVLFLSFSILLITAYLLCLVFMLYSPRPQLEWQLQEGRDLHLFVHLEPRTRPGHHRCLLGRCGMNR